MTKRKLSGMDWMKRPGGILWEPEEPHLLREFRLDKGRCVRCNAPAEAYLKLLALGREATKRLAKAEGVTEARYLTKGLCTACILDVRPEDQAGRSRHPGPRGLRPLPEKGFSSRPQRI